MPAAPDAWITALERYGTMSFADVAAAAIRFGREGFGFQSISHEVMTEAVETIRRYPQNAAIYMPDGDVPKPGTRFFQTDLANSIQYMADQETAAARKGGRAAGLAAARDAFYRGDIAQKIVAYHKANEGWLREDDLVGVPCRCRDTAERALWRRDGIRLPAVVPGTGAAADIEDPRRHRPESRLATTRRPISIRL